MKLNCDFKIDERAHKNSFVISVIANVQLESLAPLLHVLYVADVDYFHLTVFMVFLRPHANILVVCKMDHDRFLFLKMYHLAILQSHDICLSL
jgi:hypothetical protein